MKKDLINVIKKYIINKTFNNIYLNDTPFGIYNGIERLIISQTNDLFLIPTETTHQNIPLNNLIKIKSEEYFIELFLTIYEKIKEIEQNQCNK